MAHEVLSVCIGGEVLVTLPVNRNRLNFNRNLGSVFHRKLGSAERVRAAHDECHWHRVDFADVDFSTDTVAISPLLHSDRLIEAISETELHPVLESFDRARLCASIAHLFQNFALNEIGVFTDPVNDFVPFPVVKCIDIVLLELHDSLAHEIGDDVGKVRAEARCQLDYSLQAFAEEVVVVVGKCVVHLGCALRVADILDFLLAGGFFDGFDLGWLVIHSHVRPVKVPIFRLFWRQSQVTLTVLGAAIVTKPHIVTGVDKL